MVDSSQLIESEAFQFSINYELPTINFPPPPAVSFLLHFPSDCSALTLSSTVPCAARTFLARPGAFRRRPGAAATTAATVLSLYRPTRVLVRVSA